MPIYKRGPNRYCIRIYSQGKPKDWIVKGTKAEAEQFEARKRIELAAAGPIEYRTAPSFGSFCVEKYKPHAKARLGHNTWHRKRRFQVQQLVTSFGTTRLDEFTAPALVEYQNKRLEQVGPVTVNDELKVLRVILNWAAKQTVPGVKVPKVERLAERKRKGRVMVWTQAEVNKLYAAVQTECPKLLGMVVVMINTGMRKGEVLALEWSWVDAKNGMLYIQPNDSWQPKNNEPREVPLGDAALPWLDVPVGRREHERYVFPTRRKLQANGRWAASRYVTWPQLQFDRAVKTAGIGGSPHVARHTYASHFLQAQPDLYLLAKVLGHSHERVTLLYSHLLPDHLKRARNAVNMPAPLTLIRHGSDTVSGGKARK